MTVLGRVSGNDDETFTFVTPAQPPAGEFVSFPLNDGRTCLARVVCSTPLATFPNEFLYDPFLEPNECADFIGMETTPFKLCQVESKVVGYFDEAFGEFVDPKVMPLPGTPVDFASDELVSAVNKLGEEEPGSAFVGNVLGRKTLVSLSVKDMVSQHLSVIASTGAGKSYTVGVLMEEMMSDKNQAAILVLDPHGEYRTLTELANHKDFASAKYRPEVRVWDPDQINIRIADLRFSDILAIMDDGNMSERMIYFFQGIYREVRRRARADGIDITYAALREEVLAHCDGEDDNAKTYNAILWRLAKLENPIFDDYQHMDLSQFFRPGRLTVLDLSGREEFYQQLVATVLLRRLFEARKGTVTGKYTSESTGDQYIPYPTFVVLEEAHRFAPQNGEAKSKAVLKTILAEGRKFGIGVCLISQRPAKLDQDSLSQCMTQITMRIINPVDQNQVSAAVEGLGRDLLRELPGLARGQAVISGIGLNTPTMVQVRKRKTSHGGMDIDAPIEWRNYSESGASEAQEDSQPDVSYLEEDSKDWF